jgi:hypothetical protein
MAAVHPEPWLRALITNNLFSNISEKIPEPTQPPLQWELGTHFRGEKRTWYEAENSSHLLLRLRMVVVVLPFPPYAFIALTLSSPVMPYGITGLERVKRNAFSLTYIVVLIFDN